MTTGNGKAINVGVDWLTITSRNSFGEKVLYDTFNDLIPHLDEQPEEWAWNGYRGLIGKGLSCGTRRDGSILRATAEWSNEVVWGLPKVKDIRPSRVDLQVTVQLDSDNPALAEEIYGHRTEYTKGMKRPPTFTFWNSSDGGQTVYSGKRTSPRVVRVYDKWRESGKQDVWENCWRFEVELKGQYAAKWWGALCREEITLGDTAAVVKGHCEASGIPALWGDNDDAKVVEVGARVSSDAMRLEWLRRQVAPCVAKLINNGQGDKVIEALFPNSHSKDAVFELFGAIMREREDRGNGGIEADVAQELYEAVLAGDYYYDSLEKQKKAGYNPSIDIPQLMW